MPIRARDPNDRERHARGKVLAVWILAPLAAWAALYIVVSWLMR